MDPIVKVSNLSIRYGGKIAVKSCSFDIAAGSTFGLLGSNGSGKSSIIRTLCGLNRNYSGSVRVDGRDAAYADLSGTVGLVPQDYAFFRDFTVGENLDYFGSLYGLGNGARRERTAAIAGMLGLDSYQGVRSSDLSGGYQRLLNIGLALLNTPKLLLLDEPTVGLDVGMRGRVWEILGRIKKQGCALVITTHYMEEAEHACDLIALVDQGSVSAMGSPGDLIDKYGGDTFVKIEMDKAADVAPALQRSGMFTGARQNGNAIAFSCSKRDTMAALVMANKAIAATGAQAVETRVDEPSLNNVFENVVGHGL